MLVLFICITAKKLLGGEIAIAIEKTVRPDQIRWNSGTYTLQEKGFVKWGIFIFRLIKELGEKYG
ncbi:hypothetical protein CJP46_21475 [Paenibacillus sp. XY044]|nr:hypothetical protein CJP46_21475 [Paenibacillus sp. XY044]